MKYLIYILVIIILTGLQIGLFSYLKLFSVAPNLLLLFLIGVCLQRGSEDSFLVAFLSGLFLEFSIGILPGSYSLPFLILAALLYFVIYRLVVFELSWKYLLAVAIASTIFVELSAWLIGKVALHYSWTIAVVDFGILKRRIIFEIIYNTALIYPIFILAVWINNIILSLQGKKYRIM